MTEKLSSDTAELQTVMDLNFFVDNFTYVLLVITILICCICVLYNSNDPAAISKHNTVSEEGKIFKKAAVASTSQFHEEYVTEILRKGGSAADAAIVALTVQGVLSPQSLGVGGGFLLLYYDRKNTQMHVLNAREYSPLNTAQDMFKNSKSPTWGGLSSAIPGELMGYWELHQRFGKLPWASLFEPAIKLCRDGIPVTKVTGDMLLKLRKFIINSPTLKEIFWNPTSEDVYKDGELMKRPELAKTFEIIAKDGVEAFYNGSLTQGFVEDVQENGGVMTVQDLNNYKAKWTQPISLDLPGNKKIYTSPCPGSGQVFLAILDVIFSLGKSDSPPVNWFRIVEAWKHAFGHRSIMDGPLLSEELKKEKYDPAMAKMIAKIIQKDSTTSADVRHYATDFEKLYKEGGTCHISILAPNGDAVSVTSSVNYAIGAMYASRSTGIIMNNHMMDFAIPHYMDKFYVSNQLEPEKQPVSCMVPSIIINSKTKDVKMVVGAAGGFKIITTASQLIIETLFFGIPQNLAIAHRRLHHQLVPMVLFYEDDFPKDILDELKKCGHHVERILPGSSGAIITVKKDGIRANGDPRRRGSSGGF